MPNRLWVVNASPIISLANIAHAHLLPDSCDQLIIPRAVEQEILDGSDDDLAKHWISTTGQQWVQDIGSVVHLWRLGILVRVKVRYSPGVTNIRSISLWLKISLRGNLRKLLALRYAELSA